MTNRVIKLKFVALSLILSAGMTPVRSQLVDRPIEKFEFVSWTDKPSDLKTTFGYAWFRFGRMVPLWADAPTGDSLMSFGGYDTAFGFKVNLVFSYTHSDSNLVALTLLGIPHNLKGDVNEELDLLEETVKRAYGEPQSSLTIPLMAKTIVWNMKRSTVRMVRTRAVIDGVTLIYKPLKSEMNSKPN